MELQSIYRYFLFCEKTCSSKKYVLGLNQYPVKQRRYGLNPFFSTAQGLYDIITVCL